jgi:hypothetical protein
MLILDTDHLSALDRSSAAGVVLERRLDASAEDVAATIVSAYGSGGAAGWPKSISAATQTS